MTSPRVLVVDDEADLRELLEITLVRMGLDVDSAECLKTARSFLAQNDYALVLTDMRLPDGMGIELVSEVSSRSKNTPIAVVTAYGSAENAVVALKAGAFDYVSKPVALDQLRLLVQSALGVNQAGGAEESKRGGQQHHSRMMGDSRAMQELRAQIGRLARSMAPISITGESGSGKELAAREIHAQSARANKPFIAVNCGAIPEMLMEAEFFGYRKGAFTGANDERDGFFQAANGGTLMLDEVADLPLPMQVKLLRAIQERRVRKIGATSEEPVDVRIISATHQNLAEWVEKGKFRQDLFYRLNVIELSLPPLRERLDDLALLTGAILQKLANNHGHQARLSSAALSALRDYSFPGNVRELENILERALAFANDGVIEVVDLALKPGKSVPEAGGRRASDHISEPAQSLPPVAKPSSAEPAVSQRQAETAPPPAPSSPPAAAAPVPAPVPVPAPAPANFVPLFAASAANALVGFGKATMQFATTPVQMLGKSNAQEAPPLSTLAPVELSPSVVDTMAQDIVAMFWQHGGTQKNLPNFLDHVERQIITSALEKTIFNRTNAAELLGISFRQLRYQMQRLDIHEPGKDD